MGTMIVVIRKSLLIAGSWGPATIDLSTRIRERLQVPLDLVPFLASKLKDSPEPQVQLPACTTPARIEEREIRIPENAPYG